MNERSLPPARSRRTGVVGEAAPGILWLRIPLPFPPHVVNCWLLQDEDGWTVVDTGASLEAAAECWMQVFEQLGPPTRVIVTHAHPDHCGAAGWMCERFGAELLMAREEWLLASLYAADTDAAIVQRNAGLLRLCGLDAPAIHALQEGDPAYRFIGPMPPACHMLNDGDRIVIGATEWQVLTGHGHCLTEVCLWSPARRILLVGDHVLTGVIPTIGTHPFEPDADPLGKYLGSIPRFRGLDPETLVLPGHGDPFSGLEARIAEIEKEQLQRLEDAERACARPATVAEVLHATRGRSANRETWRLQLYETVAILTRLVRQGRLRRSCDNGTWLHEHA